MQRWSSGSDHWLPTLLLLAALTFWAGFIGLALRHSALSPAQAGTVVAVFPPSANSEWIFTAVLQAGGRLVNGTWLDSAWVVHSDDPGFVGRLRANGAWAAFKPALFRPITIAGCFVVLPDTGPVRESRSVAVER